MSSRKEAYRQPVQKLEKEIDRVIFADDSPHRFSTTRLLRATLIWTSLIFVTISLLK